MLAEFVQRDIEWLLHIQDVSILGVALLGQFALSLVPVKENQAVLLVGVCQVVLSLFVMALVPEWTAVSIWFTLSALLRIFTASWLAPFVAIVFALFVQTQLHDFSSSSVASLSVFSWLGLATANAMLTRSGKNHFVLSSIVLALFTVFAPASIPGAVELVLWALCLVGGLCTAVYRAWQDVHKHVGASVLALLIGLATLQPQSMRERLPEAFVADMQQRSQNVEFAVVMSDATNAVQQAESVVGVYPNGMLVNVNTGDTLSEISWESGSWFVSSRVTFPEFVPVQHKAYTLSGWTSSTRDSVSVEVHTVLKDLTSVQTDSTWLLSSNKRLLAHVIKQYAATMEESYRLGEDSLFVELIQAFDPNTVASSGTIDNYSHIIRIGELLYLAGESEHLSELVERVSSADHQFIPEILAYRLARLQSPQQGLQQVVANVHQTDPAWLVAMHESELSMIVEHNNEQSALRYAHMIRWLYDMNSANDENGRTVYTPDWDVVYRQLYARVHNSRRF